MYEETVKWENRYLCGPRLAAELSGAARVVLANKKGGWLSTQDGSGKVVEVFAWGDEWASTSGDSQSTTIVLQGAEASSGRTHGGILCKA